MINIYVSPVTWFVIYHSVHIMQSLRGLTSKQATLSNLKNVLYFITIIAHDITLHSKCYMLISLSTTVQMRYAYLYIMNWVEKHLF